MKNKQGQVNTEEFVMELAFKLKNKSKGDFYKIMNYMEKAIEREKELSKLA